MILDEHLDLLRCGQRHIFSTSQTSAQFAIVDRQKPESRFGHIGFAAVGLDLTEKRAFLARRHSTVHNFEDKTLHRDQHWSKDNFPNKFWP